MIETFKCHDTELLFKGRRVARFVNIERVALRKLEQLQIAGRLDDLRVPPNNSDRTGRRPPPPDRRDPAAQRTLPAPLPVAPTESALPTQPADAAGRSSGPSVPGRSRQSSVSPKIPQVLQPIPANSAGFRYPAKRQNSLCDAASRHSAGATTYSTSSSTRLPRASIRWIFAMVSRMCSA